jgi:hypothetical protein
LAKFEVGKRKSFENIFVQRTFDGKGRGRTKPR